MLRSVEQLPSGIQALQAPPVAGLPLVAFADDVLYWRSESGWEGRHLPESAGHIRCCTATASAFVVGTDSGQIWFSRIDRQAPWHSTQICDHPIIAIYSSQFSQALGVVSASGEVYYFTPQHSTAQLARQLPYPATNDCTVLWQQIDPPPSARAADKSSDSERLVASDDAPKCTSDEIAVIPSKERKMASEPETLTTPTRREAEVQKKEPSAPLSAKARPTIVLDVKRRVDAHSGWLTGILHSANRNELVTTGADGWIRTWNLGDLTLRKSWVGHLGGVTDSVLLKSGQLCTIGEDGTLRQWDVESGKERLHFTTGDQRPTAMTLLPDETTILVACETGNVQHFQLDNGELLGTFPFHERLINGIWYQDSDRLVITVANDRLIKGNIWPDGQQKFVLNRHQDWVNSVIVTKNGRTFFTAGDDMSVIAWRYNKRTPEMDYALNLHQGWVKSLLLSGDEKWLFSTGVDGWLFVWDTDGGRQVGQIDLQEATGPMVLVNAGHLYVGDAEGRLHQLEWSLRLHKT